MGENSGQIGTKDINKRYPVESDSGLDADQYHAGRKIQMEAEEGSVVSAKVKRTL